MTLCSKLVYAQQALVQLLRKVLHYGSGLFHHNVVKFCAGIPLIVNGGNKCLYAAALALYFVAALSNNSLFSARSNRNGCCASAFSSELGTL